MASKRLQPGSEERPGPDEHPEQPSRADDIALDLLADVLRVLGETAIDLDDEPAAAIRDAFYGWARHLLVGAARPGHPEHLEPPALALEQRDWVGARRFTVQHRRREHDFVRRSLADLRESIWTFIREIGRSLSDDHTTDRKLKEQLARMRKAVESDSTDDIRREVISAVGAMGRALAERRREQREQFSALGERVRELRRELRAARAPMERDPLTKLYIRAALDQHLSRVVDLAALFGEPVALFMLDVDHLKWVNDSFGHPAGDEVLRAVARAIDRTLQRREDLLARYGGDEFAVVAAADSPEAVARIAERLLHAVRDAGAQAGAETLRVSISIGAACLVQGEDVAAWLERAEGALCQAKQDGRDCFHVA